LGRGALADREDLEDLEAEPDQMVRHHHRRHLHRHQVLGPEPEPEHRNRKEFQPEWRDGAKAHRQVAGLHLLLHRRNHLHRRVSRKAQEAGAEKNQWEDKWVVGRLGQEQEFELYLYPYQLSPKEEQSPHAVQGTDKSRPFHEAENQSAQAAVQEDP
jgi:hypothetical protein